MCCNRTHRHSSVRSHIARHRTMVKDANNQNSTPATEPKVRNKGFSTSSLAVICGRLLALLVCDSSSISGISFPSISLSQNHVSPRMSHAKFLTNHSFEQCQGPVNTHSSLHPRLDQNSPLSQVYSLLGVKVHTAGCVNLTLLGVKVHTAGAST